MSSDTPQQPAAEQRLALRSVIIIQKIRLDDGRRTFFGYSTNISCSGLFVSTVSPANPGSRFHLEFTLPTPLNEMVRCDCEVVWNRHFSENSPFEPGMGLRFIDLEEEIRIRIDDWIRQATAE
ncbi:MAG: PilZ domain-containing protein [Desulfuromonadaceae bacterium]|nr:PilZ domain-containing protein [Desulfuromonadaceae bacterium]